MRASHHSASHGGPLLGSVAESILKKPAASIDERPSSATAERRCRSSDELGKWVIG